MKMICPTHSSVTDCFFFLVTVTFLLQETTIHSTGSENCFYFTSSSIRFLSKLIVLLWWSEYLNFY